MRPNRLVAAISSALPGGGRPLPPGLVPALAVILATLVAYLPAMRAAFVWDDPLYIADNANLRRLDGLYRIWFVPFSSPSPYPLVFTTYWFEYRLWGESPLGYHVVNALLHAANGALLGAVLSRLRVPGAWLAAALFALHPLRVESVAQAAERKDVLSGFFYFLSLLAWLRWREGGRPRDWWRSFGAFVLAMCSKTVVCTLPVAMLLIEAWRPRAVRPSRRAAILEFAPFFAVGLALGLWTVLWERLRTGAAGEHFDLSLAERSLIAGRALWFYATKTFAPFGLMPLYPKWEIDATSLPQILVAVSALGPLAIAAVARRRIGNGPLVALLLYGLTLGPALGFFDYSTMYYSYVMDHYQYLAGAALVALAAAGWSSAWEGREGAPRAFGRGVALAALAGLGVLSWHEGTRYRTLVDYWSAAAAANPASSHARYDLGVALRDAGRREEAMAAFDEAIRLQPNHVDARLNRSGLLEAEGRVEEAIAELRVAVACEPPHAKARRSRAQAAVNLGLLIQSRGEEDEALALFRSVLAERPGFPPALAALATLDFRQGRLEEAVAGFRAALEHAPSNLRFRENLGLALLRTGDPAGALEQFEHVAAEGEGMQAVVARLRAGGALLALGRAAEAGDRFREVLRADPDSPDANSGLAEAQAREGRVEVALELYRKALAVAPDRADIHANMGTTFARAGRMEDARRCWNRALELDPDQKVARENLRRAETR